jgi:hypothetical protein
LQGCSTKEEEEQEEEEEEEEEEEAEEEEEEEEEEDEYRLRLTSDTKVHLACSFMRNITPALSWYTIIIIFIKCNWFITWWQWLFYM